MASLKELRQHLEILQNLGIKELYKYQSNHARLLAEKEREHSDCRLCPLAEGRIMFVYGSGNPEAKAMIIGEAPGEQENLMGKPFVGKAGELLDKMLLAIELSREDIYIANIVKCRPPGNRNPESSERLACLPYLMEQIAIIKPKLFLFMGLVAAQTLLGTTQSMGILRQTVHEFDGIPAYVTYHPAALLRNPEWKRPAWEDLQEFQKHYLKLL